MTIQFQCKGCNYERTEPESEHARKGFCASCDAKGVGLKQIKKVEKWEARDGSFHDTLEAAERHQLHRELQTALKTCEGFCDRQATHLLSHFDIVRKGDPLPGVLYMPTFTPPDLIEAAKPALWFWGGFLLALACSGALYYFTR